MANNLFGHGGHCVIVFNFSNWAYTSTTIWLVNGQYSLIWFSCVQIFTSNFHWTIQCFSTYDPCCQQPTWDIWIVVTWLMCILLGMEPRRPSGLSHNLGGLFSSLVDVSYMCIVPIYCMYTLFSKWASIDHQCSPCTNHYLRTMTYIQCSSIAPL